MQLSFLPGLQRLAQSLPSPSPQNRNSLSQGTGQGPQGLYPESLRGRQLARRGGPQQPGDLRLVVLPGRPRGKLPRPSQLTLSQGQPSLPEREGGQGTVQQAGEADCRRLHARRAAADSVSGGNRLAVREDTADEEALLQLLREASADDRLLAIAIITQEILLVWEIHVEPGQNCDCAAED
jgi:hypothetical protein